MLTVLKFQGPTQRKKSIKKKTYSTKAYATLSKFIIKLLNIRLRGISNNKYIIQQDRVQITNNVPIQN